LLYCFIILKCLYWLCFYEVLFGSNSIIFSKAYPIKSISDLAFWLYSKTDPALAYYFIFPVLGLSVLNLVFPKLYFITDLILWFLVVNLHTKIYSSLTGGDYLVNQFLFINCFLSASFTISSTWQNNLKRVLHNFGTVAILVQVCLVYFLSALAKLGDMAWLSGKALPMIAQVHHFSMYDPLIVPAFLLVILNYVVLLYQLSFPVLIWFNKIKKPLILLGIGMHLYIAFVMGLTGFGLIMLIPYVYFWPQNIVQKMV